ncbi:hypothetical protein ACVIHI_004930 [Bradyrhizobium sp. USDA 4524]|nr:hypothetical protein [Bradyrhizobium sp. USDA 4538]MCP1902715.1 hypothetical protein [Bradyrhizobium sp. USDA 4537]MCP1991628.1 hypothetical protein [Bradyrhizobium sp. USDA 4539]
MHSPPCYAGGSTLGLSGTDAYRQILWPVMLEQ